MSSSYPRIDFQSIDFSLVVADVGISMEKARRPHRPIVLGKAFRLCDMFTVAMTQQPLLLDHTSECSCASATSCCVCGQGPFDDVRCVYDELPPGMRRDVCPVRCRLGKGTKHTLPMFSSTVSSFQRSAV